MKIDKWESCYPSNWKGLIVEDAIAHPAKYSSKLIRRIYDHLAEEGWVKKSDSVVDPFGGVALGAFDAMRLGLKWRGVELEPRFAIYGNQNIELWNARFGKMPVWGNAALLCGDSRKLVQVLVDHKYFKVAVSSPPYFNMETEKNAKSINLEKFYEVYKKSGGGQSYESFCKTQLKHSVGYSALVSSPPYAETPVNQTHMTSNKRGDKDNPNYRPSWEKKLADGYAETKREYGSESGQLGSMKSTESGFSAAVSSPPFQGNSGGTNVTAKEGVLADAALLHRHAAGNSQAGYGDAEGNLGSLVPTEKGFEAAVSSPPFENTLSREVVNAESRRNWAREHGISNAEHVSPIDMERIGARDQEYGKTAGQIGLESGDDFWLSARTIVEQVYQVLAPGAHAVWVVKDYVKGGKIVPFVDQWRQLCEAVGFETLHEHHAMLVHARQSKLEGGEHVRESKSFFRRLAEKKGSPRIDYETVLCMVKNV